jgi:hypothetical protein
MIASGRAPAEMTAPPCPGFDSEPQIVVMPYLFTCSHCQTKTLVDDQYSGRSGRCFTCGNEIRLPDFAPTENRTPGVGGSGNRKQGQTSPTFRRTIAASVVLVLVACGAVATYRYGAPAIASVQANRVKAQSMRNIARIAAALNAYAADHGTYPPPATARPDGTPMHSWRVLILPYLGHKELFNEYDMNQSWDSATNIALGSRMPAVFRGASSQMFGEELSYYLITGPGTLFPPAPPGEPVGTFLSLSPSTISDDPSKTLLVVEAVGSSGSYYSSWLEPRDLDVTAMQGLIGSAPGREIGGINPDGAVIATVDGQAHFLNAQTSPSIVMALITASGGEPLPDDILDR